MIQLSKEINLKKERTALLSIFSNSFLVIGKIMVGILTGSVGILSEAAHSGTDLLASGIAWWSIRQSSKPPDKEHAYGHGKVETISAFLESLLIIGAALWILWEAGQKLLKPAAIESISWGLGIMAFSALLNSCISYYLFKVGKETESQALIADAYHLAADIWSSLGVFFSLSIVYFTGWYWIDPIIAIFVGLWIFRTGLKLSLSGVGDLIDTALPVAEEAQIREILDADLRVYAYRQLRSRKSGSTRMVDIHIHLHKELSLEEAHRISHEIEEDLEKSIANLDIVIHIEPYHDEIDKDYEEPIIRKNPPA